MALNRPRRPGQVMEAAIAEALADLEAALAEGESAIKYKSPLSVRKRTLTRTIAAGIEHVQMNIAT